MVSVAKKAKLALPSGIFPFLKDRGVTCLELRKWVKLTLRFEEPKLKNRYYPIELVPTRTEWYMTGVFGVALGSYGRLLAAYRPYWKRHFIVTAILGKQTIDDYSESPLLSESEYGHITPNAIRSAISEFVGQNISQNYAAPIHHQETWWSEFLRDSNLNKNLKTDPMESVTVDEREPISRLNIDDMDEVESYEDEQQQSEAWEINNNNPGSHPNQHIVAHCHSIELLQVDGATLRMHVSCDGRFSCRAFVRDLGLRLGCHAAIESLHLRQVGPLVHEQALPKHELHLPQIQQSLLKHTPTCDAFLRELKTLYPDAKDKYNRWV